MEHARLYSDPVAAIAAVFAGTASGIIASTSGSTGPPRDVLLSADAVKWSASATAARIGEGHWLLALPPQRIGGAMVLARAARAKTTVTTMPPGRLTAQGFTAQGFTAQGFADAAATMPTPRLTSLVPTQVRRLLASPMGVDALASMQTVLVGGAAALGELPPNCVRTYGMTETCGGCVYDGRALDGVTVEVGADSRILLAGPMLADGYLTPTGALDAGESFVIREGQRWLESWDLGHLSAGVLTVQGRADDVIITGGEKVHPTSVETALLALPGIAEAVVVGVDDAEWGQRVAAVVVGEPRDLTQLRDAMTVPKAQRPTIVRWVDHIPRLASGKIDRMAAAKLAAQHDSTDED
jgi:O-succinylbenzoic acid--CoA ligase